jgi:hypothetical protein
VAHVVVVGCLVEHAIWLRALPPHAKYVLTSIVDFARGDPAHLARASIDDIRRSTGLSRSGVQRSLRQLEDAGEVQVLERGGGRGKSTTYRVRCDDA